MPRNSSRSHFGCATCKSRKVKCDEVKPTCGPCVKACRRCSFPQSALFRIHNETEHLPRPRSGRGARRPKSTLESPAFDKDDVWVRIPSELTFVTVDDPYESEGDIFEDQSHVAAQSPSIQGSFANSPLIRASSTPITEQSRFVQDQRDRIPLPDQGPVVAGDAAVMELRLIRIFREGPGQWLDLFDTHTYFSSRVPALASKSPLLRSSICAASAKHCQRKMDVAHIPPGVLIPQREDILQDQTWHYLAAEYYHKAIGHMKDAVSSLGVERGAVHSSCPTEEIFAAVAVLCIYELMDAPGTAWRAHLSALPLFVPDADSDSPDSPDSPSNTVTIPRNAIKRPIFWCLARQDFLCACIGETQTRLKLEDMKLWHRVGLVTDMNRFQLPFSPSSFEDSSLFTDVEEDLKGQELVCILSRAVNHITSGDAVDPKDYARPPGQRPALGVTQERLLKRWNAMMEELQEWRSSLPSTFEPIARTRCPPRPGNVVLGDNFEQIWYDLPSCAGTMVSYHLARILLLANRPQESTAVRSTLSTRLRNYRQDQQGMLYHSREICGINLADVPASVRIHSVQPLFVAGQVFHLEEDQKAILELLSSIERELGWSTTYYISKLQGEWHEDTAA